MNTPKTPVGAVGLFFIILFVFNFIVDLIIRVQFDTFYNPSAIESGIVAFIIGVYSRLVYNKQKWQPFGKPDAAAEDS